MVNCQAGSTVAGTPRAAGEHSTLSHGNDELASLQVVKGQECQFFLFAQKNNRDVQGGRGEC